MVSGGGPDVPDGVAHFTERLLNQLTNVRPQTSWVWLYRRSTKLQSPFVIGRNGVVQLRPWHTWRPVSWRFAQVVIGALRPRVVHIQDQVHSFHETAAAVNLARTAKQFGSRLVVTLHEYHVELPSVHFTDELASLADVLLVQDRRNADRCRARTGREPDAIGWSPTNIEPPPEKVTAIPCRLATFGLIGPAKGLEIVHDALRQLRPRYPELTWHILGPFEPSRNSYHNQLLKRVERDPWVKFTGGGDLESLSFRRELAEASIMLLPFSDGASPRRTTLQAAWRFELPTITTFPQIFEPAIKDGENCRLVLGGDAAVEEQIASWVGAVEALLASPEQRKLLCTGSRLAAEQHSWQRLGELHRSLYERFL